MQEREREMTATIVLLFIALTMFVDSSRNGRWELAAVGRS